MKILIIAPAWVGDMIMAQSLFKWLHTQHPGVVLDLVAPSATFALASRMPEIRQAYLLQAPHGKLQLMQRFVLGRQLRAQRYDQAIVLPNSWKSALLPFFAQIKKRTGWCGEFRYGLLNDVRILDKQKLPLMIERFCALALDRHQDLSKQLPWPELLVDSDHQQQLIKKFKLNIPLDLRSLDQVLVEQDVHPIWNDQAKGKVLAICPGAEYGLSKRWPVTYFAEVAQNFLNQSGQVWILGGPKDQTIAEEINTICEGSCLNLAGKTSLVDAIDLLALASIVLTNDSGLMHMAAAVQTPLVVIYGSTSPGFTPPLSQDVTILSLKLSCSPCFQRTCRFGHYHCLTELTPPQVIEAVNKAY